ncbi:hypothetical protein [Pleionea sediminis]|uniref:hypothetical protein n=1 Tax=Pleionea sediminis TaxID=2569479 RepID=UPI001184DD82|nr:hypothetical protein [Pleionea sediminis]
MNLKSLLASLVIASTSVVASAENDVYGTVSELITRTGPNGDHQIYFRMDVNKSFSNFEDCAADRENLIWTLDVTSPVLSAQYDLIRKSYIKKRPLRVIGYPDFCESGDFYADKVFELSPWNWQRK